MSAQQVRLLIAEFIFGLETEVGKLLLLQWATAVQLKNESEVKAIQQIMDWVLAHELTVQNSPDGGFRAIIAGTEEVVDASTFSDLAAILRHKLDDPEGA